MDQFTHTIIAILSIYFAFKVGRNIQNKSLCEEVVSATLNSLEKKGLIKYEIKNGQKVYQTIKDIKK